MLLHNPCNVNRYCVSKYNYYVKFYRVLHFPLWDFVPCEKINAPLPEIEATEKYVTVTIHGCEKYMQLLNKSTSTDSPIRQSADSADIVSDRQKQILEAMEVGYEYKSDEIGVLVGLKPSRSRQLLSKQAAAFR